VFEQLSSAIGRQVLELQNDSEEVDHAGLKGKNNL